MSAKLFSVRCVVGCLLILLAAGADTYAQRGGRGAAGMGGRGGGRGGRGMMQGAGQRGMTGGLQRGNGAGGMGARGGGMPMGRSMTQGNSPQAMARGFRGGAGMTGTTGQGMPRGRMDRGARGMNFAGTRNGNIDPQANNVGSIDGSSMTGAPQDIDRRFVGNGRGLMRQGQAMAGQPGGGRRSSFGRLDTDRDGLVQISDVPEQFQERFGGFDTNGDGAVDRDERNAALGNRGSRRGGDRNRRNRLADSEGNVSIDQLPERVQERAGELDANGDGILDTSELPNRGRRPARRNRQGVRFDTNGDGILQQNEVPEQHQQRFAELDTSGDGVLDRAELAAARPQRNQGQENQVLEVP